MAEILSAQELDALLTREPGGTVPSAPPPAACTPFSFEEPPPLSGPRRERLGAAGSRLAEELGRRLDAELRRSVTASLSGVDLASRATAMRATVDGVSMRLDEAGSRFAAMLVLDVELALAMVEARLGGAIAESQPKRALTPVEEALLVRLVRVAAGPAVRGFLTALSDDAPPEALECRLADPSALWSAGFAAATLQLAAEGRGGRAVLFVPVTRLGVAEAPVKRVVASGSGVPARTLFRMPVRVAPRIPGGRISLAELSQLAPGRVVRLDHPKDAPIEITCNGTGVLHGRIVRAGDQTALEVTDWAAATPDDEKEERP